MNIKFEQKNKKKETGNHPFILIGQELLDTLITAENNSMIWFISVVGNV